MLQSSFTVFHPVAGCTAALLLCGHSWDSSPAPQFLAASTPWATAEPLMQRHPTSLIVCRVSCPACAGCLLYFLLYGISPFQSALGQTGGSLALAVLNGSVSFPASAARSPQVSLSTRGCHGRSHSLDWTAPSAVNQHVASASLALLALHTMHNHDPTWHAARQQHACSAPSRAVEVHS